MTGHIELQLAYEYYYHFKCNSKDCVIEVSGTGEHCSPNVINVSEKIGWISVGRKTYCPSCKDQKKL